MPLKLKAGIISALVLIGLLCSSLYLNYTLSGSLARADIEIEQLENDIKESGEQIEQERRSRLIIDKVDDVAEDDLESLLKEISDLRYANTTCVVDEVDRLQVILNEGLIPKEILPRTDNENNNHTSDAAILKLLCLHGLAVEELCRPELTE